MTAVVTATPDLVNMPPRMVLNLSGFSGTTVTVTRTDVAGNQVTVRAANPAPLSGGGAVVFDYEPQYGRQSTWSAVSNTGATTTATVSAVMPATQPWLIHPGIPSLSVPLVVAGIGDMAADVTQGVHRPLGRKYPIVITTGQRQAPAFDLQVLTGSQGDEDQLWTLLDDASTLLLQVGYDPSVGVTRAYYLWVAVGQVTRAGLSPYIRPEMGGDDFMWTLPCTVSSRPSGALQAQRTWADVAAAYPTWAAASAAYSTWRDLILDNQSTSSAALVTGESFVDNGDGTWTSTTAVDNGDGTWSANVTDNGDGTWTA